MHVFGKTIGGTGKIRPMQHRRVHTVSKGLMGGNRNPVKYVITIVITDAALVSN